MCKIASFSVGGGDKCASCLFWMIILSYKSSLARRWAGRKRKTQYLEERLNTSPKSRPTEQMCPCGTIKTLSWVTQSAAVMHGDQRAQYKWAGWDLGYLFWLIFLNACSVPSASPWVNDLAEQYGCPRPLELRAANICSSLAFSHESAPMFFADAKAPAGVFLWTG